MNKYGYIRVSRRDQNIARQVEAMLDIGIRKPVSYTHLLSKTEIYLT